ncbi:hypothetical protein [Roseobacter sp. HKCC-CH-9208]|uniref:hypothetical protein n=1 Tax=Roseobacter sp. HKCC-CH-9208 TaxID=3120339 RepID=UPI0030ECEC96
MQRKVVHEHTIKIPRVVTVGIYAVAIALGANAIKPILSANPAFAELNPQDTIKVRLVDAQGLSVGTPYGPFIVANQ